MRGCVLCVCATDDALARVVMLRRGLGEVGCGGLHVRRPRRTQSRPTHSVFLIVRIRLHHHVWHRSFAQVPRLQVKAQGSDVVQRKL